MIYIEEADAYVCSNSRILWPSGIHHKKSASGYRSELTVYECEDCSGCPNKAKCTKAQGNRRMKLSKTFIEKRKKSYKNITTDKGSSIKSQINKKAYSSTLKNHENPPSQKDTSQSVLFLFPKERTCFNPN